MGKLTISMAIFNSYVSHNQEGSLPAFFPQRSRPRHELREQFVQLTTAAAFASDGEALAAEETFAARWPAEVADGRRPATPPKGYPLVMTNSELLKMVIYSGFSH